MGAFIDLTGKRFGKWTVLEKSSIKKNNQIYWTCKCDCGTIRDVNGASLRNNKSKDCGCGRIQKNKQIENLIGQKFNTLTVLQRIDNKWQCKCDCGNITYVSTSNLKNGHIKHCKKCGDKIGAKKRTINLIGKHFGYLTVIKQAESDKNGTRWLCQCKCGNKKIISGSSLTQELTKSCGCLKSLGEATIINLLQNNNIPYEYQKSFDNCRFTNTNKKAIFDFYVNKTYIIEYDGQQHFRYTGNGWCTKEEYEKIQFRDNEKNLWCKKNNIPIIRIPYTKIKTLDLKDLIPETSQFLLN